MTTPANKARRHHLITDLVAKNTISSQQDLAGRLTAHGHPVSQATLSRDLRELAISRVPTPDGYRYLPREPAEPKRPSPPASLRAVTAAEVLAVEANEVTAVVKTQIGRAQGVAVFLDSLDLPDVLATLAGDDTVIVLPKSVERTRELEEALRGVFGLS